MRIPTGKPEAAAWVSGEGCLRGVVKFYAIPRGTLVAAEIMGLPESETGFFAFHIHEGSQCAGEGYESTGGHFNPLDAPHPNHAGDMPPLLSRGGRAMLVFETGRFRPEEVVGRTVVIHSGSDDFHSQPSGNAGRKLGCGVIRRIS